MFKHCDECLLLPDEAGLCDGCENNYREIARLQAIVDRLPKTADGVPVMPGDDVWVGPSSPHCCFVNGIMPGDVVRLDFHGHSYATVVGKKDTYSTREAAEAAGGNDGISDA